MGVPVSPEEAGARTHWRAVFGAFVLDEQDRPVRAELAGGTVLVSAGGQDAELSEHDFVQATVCRLEDDGAVPAGLSAVLCCLA